MSALYIEFLSVTGSGVAFEVTLTAREPNPHDGTTNLLRCPTHAETEEIAEALASIGQRRLVIERDH